MKWNAVLVCMAVLSLVLTNACGSNQQSEPSQGHAAIATTSASSEQLVNHVRYLASDELAGRAPGSRGEEMTLTYLTEQYVKMGYRPGNTDGSYVQAVPLVGFAVTNTPPLELESKQGRFDCRYGADFMCWTLQRKTRVTVRNEQLVFVGYGIVAPEYDWDDYKDVDVRGKIIVMLVGDPPLPDTTQFGGRAMTYYGRWTYKFEIAAEKGAAGALIIHNTEAAGYPWEVVSNSWGGEQFDNERLNDGMDRCALEGWVTAGAGEEMFARLETTLSNAYEKALSRSFRPTPLAVTASVTMDMVFRKLRSYNVVARLEGRDPRLKNEYVIYTAHWDHLGKGVPADGDSIYNGAVDNASGVAATLEIARLFTEHKGQLKRSVVFLNTTAEESGLLGAYHYAENPLYPLDRTVATINIDGANIWGRTKDMVVIGYGFSDLDDYLQTAIEPQDRYLKPDAEPEKGYYYRSDHFAFAKKGVPSLYADSGIEFISKPPRWGIEARQRYTTERYHKPNDEYDESWDLTGGVEDVEALFRVGLMVASTDVRPEWREGSGFKGIRDRSVRKTAP
jgi:Zn-dependent M28 family amino/carboxypeptidase